MAAGTTYYVSSTGDDSADGLTPATAWKSVAKVDATPFAPGSQVLFARGGEWHEQLSASSSGTADAPITYGAYGSGAKPTFWGSDPVANASFTKVNGTGSTYSVPYAQTVNSFFADHSFYHDAALVTHSSDPATNRAYVDANPNSWSYDNGTLYVNTNGVNPTSSGQTYTAAVRDDVVYSNAKDNLVFKDLVVNESAKADAGYAFRVQNSQNVTIEDSEAYNAGKHHFGVINSNNFVGARLFTSTALPDQGYGGATAYVAYSDGQASTHDSSQWIDCTATNNGPSYPAFYTHGPGVGDILVKNMTVHGGPGIAIGTESTDPQNIRIQGGLLDNAGIVLYGKGTVVDGVRMTGPASFIDAGGQNNVLQNMLITGASPAGGYQAVMLDRGTGNTFQFNTVVLNPNAPYAAVALGILNQTTTTHAIGNIFDGPNAVVREFFQGQGSATLDYNLYPANAHVFIDTALTTMAQWQAQGFDLDTLLTDPQFVDALNNDFHLATGAPGIDLIADGMFAGMPLTDFEGILRPQHGAYDVGAFEVTPEPAGASLALLGVALVSLGRRQRRQV